MFGIVQSYPYNDLDGVLILTLLSKQVRNSGFNFTEAEVEEHMSFIFSQR